MKKRMEIGNGESQPPKLRFGGLERMFRNGKPSRSNSGSDKYGQPPPLKPTEVPAESPRLPENGDRIEGVTTDQKLLHFFYRLKGVDAHAIATDSFLDKSRQEYNAEWLARELVQNFVDHNPQHPGTLDGVRFTSEPLKSGGKRFRIEGSWPFEDPTGVLSPHSDKPDDRNTAGGNGIGLKQTAIRFLRDFGVQRFEIDGEGWVANYRLAKAADVNTEWASMPGQVPLPKVKHDWLLVDFQETQPTGRNAYIIETANPDLIKALDQLPTLGVSHENPYLQDMDFENKFGGIKWLPKPEGLEPARGRLFINGQVMNYKEKGATAEDYWVGPESITIQLNNLKYKMSIDRPPVNPFDLEFYMDDMVQAMSKDEIVEQLKRSQHLWAGHVDSTYSSDRQGAFVVVEKLVRTLPNKGYDPREWQQHFADKNYIAWDIGVSESQIGELEKQGFIICPVYFEQVGMSSASSKLSTEEAASNETPQIPQHKREQFAKDYGMEVACEEFLDKNPEEFIRLVSERLTGHVVAVEGNGGNSNTIHLRLNGDIPKNLLFHALPRPRKDDQKLLYFLRGMARYGLEKGMFKKIFTSQGNFVTTFGLDYDPVTKEYALLARNIPSKSDKGTFVEIELDERYLQEFQDAFHRKIEAARVSDQQSPQGTPTSPIRQGELAQPVTEIQGSIVDTTTTISQPEGRQWMTKEEQLYKAAVKKNPAELTDEDRLIIQRKNQLQQEFGSVPVSQPDAPDLDAKGNVATMSDAEKVRVAQMEAQLPGVIEAVNKLEELVPEPTIAEPTGHSRSEKYLQWRQSDQFYGQLGDNAGYLRGRHLLELIEEQNKADISSVHVTRDESPQDRILDALQSKLKDIVDRMNPAEDEVDDFEIVLAPTEKQLAQLGLLRLYLQLTTGVALPNDLFIYKGTGSKGINLGQKAIGMHESLFDVKFTEAMRTFTHEVAHNYPEAEDHGNMFRHAMESLFAIMINRVTNIATKLESGQTLTPEERVILDMQKEWNMTGTL